MQFADDIVLVRDSAEKQSTDFELLVCATEVKGLRVSRVKTFSSLQILQRMLWRT